LGFSTYGAVLIYRKYDINVESNADTPLPIGGWLVLVGIGLFLTPFVVAYQLFTTPQYFNTNIWSALLDIDNSSKSMLLAVLMFLELIYNLAYFVYAILLFILFSKRRTIFPKLAILLMIIIPIVTILDTIATAGLGYQYLSFEDFGDILRSIIASIIWIPYLLISKRVKKTFIINLNPAQSI
jgi:hypothetical protein